MKLLRPLFRRSAVEREMDAELRFHYEHLVEDLVSQGVAPNEAARRARLEFGGLEQIKDDSREARMADRLMRMGRGVRIAARSLRRSPGFTATAVATLALGIGVNTLIFSALDQVVLRSLPLPEPNRLVVFRSPGPWPGMERDTGPKMSFSYPRFRDFRGGAGVFEGVAARFRSNGTLTWNGATEAIDVELVSGNYFTVLGIKPAAGRVFVPEDEQHPMNDAVAVLSYGYWQKRFGGDPAMVGRKVSINGMAMTVVGVSAKGYHGMLRGASEEVRVPMTMKSLFTPTWRGGLERRSWAWLNIVARMKPGLTREQAEAGANVLYNQVIQEESKNLPQGAEGMRDEFLKKRLELVPASGGITPRNATKLFLIELSGMAAVVLLIACVNLASLLMARTAARQRELAIRLALGAGRLGVVKLLLAENLLVAGAGGILAVLLAAALGKPVFVLLLSESAADLYTTTPDLRILLFAFGATLLTASAVSLAPVFEARRAQLADILKADAGVSAGRGQVRLRKCLVMAQVSFCVWLLMTAGLFARTLANLRAVDMGFHKENLVTFGLDPTMIGMKSDATMALCGRVEAALAAMPGVQAVSFSNFGVFSTGMLQQYIEVPGFVVKGSKNASAHELFVTPGHVKAHGLQLLAGRDFNPSDSESEKVALINESFAKLYLAGKNPVGQMFRSGDPYDLEIVGVVRDQKWWSQHDEPGPAFYVPLRFPAGGSFFVRTSLAPETQVEPIRKVVEREAAGVPILSLRTMERDLDLKLVTERQMLRLAGLFGLLATVLAAVGLYGVIAYSIGRRTREIGLRIALGAAGTDVLRMVLRDVASVIAVGLAAGLPTGYAVTHLVRSQLYNVSLGDPWALAGAAIVVALVTLVAGLIPARKATLVDPATALRWD